MTSQATVEIFERAVAARARLLRVEADRNDAPPGVLALTFDVGRVVVRSNGRGLVAEAVADRGALPAGLASLDEDEPWWRVLGQPITAVWPVDSAGGGTGSPESGAGARAARLASLKLRFRESDQNPRIVALRAEGPGLHVALEGH